MILTAEFWIKLIKAKQTNAWKNKDTKLRDSKLLFKNKIKGTLFQKDLLELWILEFLKKGMIEID